MTVSISPQQQRLIKFIQNGWARWLPLSGLDLLMAVDDVEASGGDPSTCETLNGLLFRDDILARVPAFFVEQDGISITLDPDRVGRLRERERLVTIVTDLVGVPPLRTLGDLFGLMCRLHIIEAVQVDGRTRWRVSNPLPSVLDLALPPSLREQELQMQKEYAVRRN